MILQKNRLAAAIATLTVGLGTVAASTAEEVAKGNAGLRLELELLGRYETGVFLGSAAEIVQHDPLTQRLFVINAEAASVDVLDIANPKVPTRVGSFQEPGGDANSVAVFRGLVAVAFASDPKTDPGKVVFYDSKTLKRLAEFPVGALPDMVTFTPDGNAVLVANEAEPNEGYTIDPEGSVTVIDLRRVKRRLHAAELQSSAVVRTADFQGFNAEIGELRAAGVRIYGPNASVAQDLEPEYIAVAPDGKSAWVALQEANAIGVLDLSNLRTPYFSEILPLGLKDHSLPGNELDASDRDGVINIRNWPVKGLYQPDAIASYAVKGKTYYVLANEGDDRNDFIPDEETRRVSSGSVALDPSVFGGDAEVAFLKRPENLGRLTVTTFQVPRNAGGQFTELHALGGRSFSICTADGTLLYDSGSDFERITADRYPTLFNSNHELDAFDDRSDNKGPEPEGIAIGKIRGRTFAFVGLERIGGIMTYDITNPNSARFVDYVNTRPKDLGPEGLAFISAENSPNRKPLLVVGNEVSGTTSIYAVDVVGK